MKRLFLAILIFGAVVYGDGFKYLKVIKSDMPIDRVISEIQSSPNGTVLFFGDGEYDFGGRKVEINKKAFLELGGKFKKVTIKNLNLAIKNSTSIHLNGFILKNSFVYSYNSRNLNFATLLLKQSSFSMSYSSAYLYNIGSFEDYKHTPIHAYNYSNIIVSKSTISNDKGNCINVGNNSYLKLTDSTISGLNKKYPAVYVGRNSYLDVENTKFINKNYYFNKNEWPIFIYINKNSHLIAINNKFINNRMALVITNQSNAFISKNSISQVNRGVEIAFSSTATIVENSIENGIGTYSIGIFVSDKAIANINKNSFKLFYQVIILNKSAKANIFKNILDSISGFGIIINNGCLANITYTSTMNLTVVYLGEAKKYSKVYLAKNDKGMSLPGFGDPQLSSYPLDIKVTPVNDFRKVFDSVKKTVPNYKSLVPFVPKQDNLIKGYLQKNLVVRFDNRGYEDEIAKGTFVIYNADKNIIVSPKDYQGSRPITKPYIGVDSQHRNINLVPVVMQFQDKYMLYFKINSNTKVKSVILDETPIALRTNNSPYETYKRRIKDFNRVHRVVIKGDGFEISYDCKLDYNKNVTCQERKKDAL